MSLYNERYDEALSKAPWLPKACGGRTYLFKYAPHPQRPGYLFVATDLETVLFEELSASSVPTRLGHIAAQDGGESDILALDFAAQQARTDDTLRTLEGLFDGTGSGWASASVDRDVDDYFDAVFVLSLGSENASLKWIFQMTELRGRQPLTFVAKQLLSPWAALLGQDRGVSTSSTSPADAVGAIISDPGVARALRRFTGAAPRPTPTPVVTRGPSPTRAQTPTRAPPPPVPATPVPPPRVASPRSPPSPSPARTVRRRVSPQRTPPRPATERKGAAPLLPTSSPTPVAPRKVYDIAAGIFPSSETGSEEFGATNASGVETSGLPSRLPDSSPPLPPSGIPSSDVPTSSTGAMPTSTLDPLIPTQEGKRKRKKKDAKKIEEEEEAEANRRRQEMKRRMASGGGASRLGRRRA